MELNFVLDQDINRSDRLAPILTELGLAARNILSEAQAKPAKQQLRQQTEQARSGGVFGAPTFFVGTEMFWGNDRLDDALRLASCHHADRDELVVSRRMGGTHDG
jgi:2-hydroxychromene-2-carboxylate isomerase